MAGSGILAVLALAERRWDFLLLDVVWGIVSLWGLLSLALGRDAPAAP